MGHPDNGRLQAFLDGELPPPEAGELRAHLAGCQECKDTLAVLEGAAAATSGALALLDVPPSTGAAWRRLEARREARTRGRRPSFWSLPRAASVALLLMAGTAAALPGSPVRRWLADGWEALTGAPESPSPREAPGEVARPEMPPGIGPAETGAATAMAAGAIQVWLHDLPADADLRVRWIEGQEAWVYAGEGTRFNSATGRLEAYAPPGAVRVEIPRGAERVLVGVDGEVILRKRGGQLEILGPVQERSPSEIHFEPPSSGGISSNEGRG